MRSLLSQLLAIGPELAAFILTSPLLASRGAFAQNADGSIPSPNLDLSQLGRVAVAGDFDSISLYSYAGQNEDAFSTNGSQSLLTRYPNGAFRSLALADAYIETMCPFIQRDGTLAGVVVGGNFTSLGGVEAQGIALYNPNTTQITALPGLSGSVSALYCDADSGIVYVGGMFLAGNSTNAMTWTTGWTNLPFAGFNGPVTSITKNGAGNLVFAGTFDGLGNVSTPKNRDEQAINLASGGISASGSCSTDGFSDPKSIICKTSADDGAGNTWLLEDNTAGYWQGNFSFGFNPTKIRLYNTQYQGRGTKTFYFMDNNSGGILNMNYFDIEGSSQSCSASCPMPQNNNTYQDFRFVPPVGMNTFRVQITGWYGAGGGLSGIEMFQDDIYSYAVNNFNEPQCDGVSTGATSTNSPSGLWSQIPNDGNSSSDYLSAYITDASQVNPSAQVVFTPDIKQSGNYSVTVFTPGCMQDNSCSTRGIVNITGSMTSNSQSVTATLFQTNNFDKFDQVYYGYVDVDTDTFKPTITLSPLPNQAVPLTTVAQRVRFELVTTTGGLNGLFEYNPNQAVVSTDFSSSVIDSAGADLNAGASINAVASLGSSLYVAGNFNGNNASNFMIVGTNVTTPAHGGLNDGVRAIYQNGSTLYLGGNFTNTADNTVTGLNSLAVYSTSDDTWTSLGAGVNGSVNDIVPVTLNITSTELEECLTINGDFTSVNGFGNNAEFDAPGFAVWVISQNNWLHNIQGSQISVSGKLISTTTVPGFSPLYAGQLAIQPLGLGGAVELVGSGSPSLQTLGIKLQSPGSSTASRKRSITSGMNYTGVYTGLFYGQNGLNITVLGGSFVATTSSGPTANNLLFINNTADTQTISGTTELDSDSIFAAMDTYQTGLYAGGAVTGTLNNNRVDGLVVYNLSTAAFATTQPPALAGDRVVVNAIATQPNAALIYVGGDFASAGSLPCASLCYYDASTQQWNTPGAGLTGVIAGMMWASNTELIIAGNLSVSGTPTTMATYDSKKQTFASFSGASTLPGPVSVLTPANGQADQFWAAGTATNNGSAYLAKYSGDAWVLVSGLGAGTSIRGLQVMSLTSNHANSALMPQDQSLLISGNLNLDSFGNSSTALFNGTTLTPFILTSTLSGGQGSVANMFVSNPRNFMSSSSHHLAVGFVVLIGLAISLGLIFLLVVAGILMERHRRRREGYVPMSTDKNGNLERIPPETLLGGLGEKGSPPKI